MASIYFSWLSFALFLSIITVAVIYVLHQSQKLCARPKDGTIPKYFGICRRTKQYTVTTLGTYHVIYFILIFIYLFTYLSIFIYLFDKEEHPIPIGLNHGLRTPRESFFSKIQNFWFWADKLG